MTEKHKHLRATQKIIIDMQNKNSIPPIILPVLIVLAFCLTSFFAINYFLVNPVSAETTNNTDELKLKSTLISDRINEEYERIQINDEIILEDITPNRNNVELKKADLGITIYIKEDNICYIHIVKFNRDFEVPCFEVQDLLE